MWLHSASCALSRSALPVIRGTKGIEERHGSLDCGEEKNIKNSDNKGGC